MHKSSDKMCRIALQFTTDNSLSFSIVRRRFSSTSSLIFGISLSVWEVNGRLESLIVNWHFVIFETTEPWVKLSLLIRSNILESGLQHLNGFRSFFPEQEATLHSRALLIKLLHEEKWRLDKTAAGRWNIPHQRRLVQWLERRGWTNYENWRFRLKASIQKSKNLN